MLGSEIKLRQVMTGEWNEADEAGWHEYLRERLMKLCDAGERAAVSDDDFKSLVKLCIKDKKKLADFTQRLDMILIIMCLYRSLYGELQAAVVWAVKQAKECCVNFDVLTGRDNYHACYVLILKYGDEVKRFAFDG